MEKKILNGIKVVDFLRKHELRFNPHPWSNPKHLTSKGLVSRKIEDGFVDLHSEVVTKVDALLAELEKEQIDEQEDPETVKTDDETVAFSPMKILYSLKDAIKK
ncbi:MAG: hypothetical protein DRM98_02155 [Thermoplasmata archaeon]|nr:MAG: hypothetical protein FE039_02735 [Thermoplasmata archaeon]RLF33522.1 MAG: hypothetical protein DRM98_02155 [Thermoplasmata archaeon]RLF52197.1 MAG: hypothetical protein DRN24_03660 [Thermoplasmata archaeon]